MRRRLNDGTEDIDEHNQPTEPIDIRISPLARTVTDDQAIADTIFPTVPAQSMLRPQQPTIGAYPYLPPPPMRQDRTGRTTTAGGVNAPENANATTSSQGKQWMIFPALVGFCFVIVQMLLLVNFVLKMIGQWDGTTWASTISMFSNLFTWPLQALLQHVTLPFAVSAQIVTLVTILLYGILSRIVVRCLKLLLHPH